MGDKRKSGASMTVIPPLGKRIGGLDPLVRRRDFFSLLGGAAAAPLWPLTVRAQQAAMPVIGYLHSASPGPFAHLVAAFREGLKQSGFVEGRNVAIEYRFAEGQYDRLPALAADLVRRQVNVIVAAAGGPPILAAKAATKTIPIVFSLGVDPVRMGLVASLNRPGGNITGVVVLAPQMEGKRLGLLREIVPKAPLVAVLLNPKNTANFDIQVSEVREAAHATGQRIQILSANTDQEIDAAFASLADLRAGALLVGADPSFNNRRDRIVALAARYAIPAIYEQREFAVAGGLMSYGTSLTDGYHQVGIYTARVLRGEKPADLPVIQSTKFEFVINLKTAKALGLDVPPELSARANEIIE
jgi:putative ABC transport system substrate-binding protein